MRRTTLTWHAGWLAVRGYAATHGGTNGADGVVTTLVGDQHREVELLLPDPEAASSVLDRAADEVRSQERAWISVVTHDAAATCRRLEQLGLEVLADHECLMSRVLVDHPRPALPDGTVLVLDDAEPHALRVRVATSDGDLAASGQVGLVGTTAVADRILTEPDHRRRGLGAAVMDMLCARAVDRGATRGLLVASPEGRTLYATLGWTRVADLVIGARAG